MWKWISLLLTALCAFSANAQEMIYPLTFNTETNRVKGSPYSSPLAKSDELLELPFVDDFSADHFPGNSGGYPVFWQNRQASRNFGWGKNPPTLGVVSFDGADEVGYPYDFNLGSGSADTLTSCPINLDYGADAQIGISFYYQPKGNAFSGPSTADSIFLEFYAPDLDEWFFAWSTSDISNSESFTFVYLPITASQFLKEGFQFRFRNYAALQGALDIWNLDYIWVDQNANNLNPVNNDVAFVRQEFTLLEELTAMPRDHFIIDPAARMRQNITVKLGNLSNSPRTLEGNALRIIAPDGNVTTYPNPTNPPIGPQSTVEYVHSVASAPNSLVLDPNLAPEELVYTIEIVHAVSDYEPTISNDTMRFQQRFFTHYSFDDGHAEAAYAIATGGAQVALKYTNYKTDSIFALQIYTMPIAYNHENTPIVLRIWQDTGEGPGDLIYQQQSVVQFDRSSYQESAIYFLDEPVNIPSGSFFVGYSQATQFQGIRVGLDFNTNSNPQRLYFKEQGSWVSSQIAGTVMIRPMFTSSGYGQMTSIIDQDSFSRNVTLYPNPVAQQMTFISPSRGIHKVQLIDMQGQKVLQISALANQQIDVSNVNTGMYLLRLEDDQGHVASKKLLIYR